MSTVPRLSLTSLRGAYSPPERLWRGYTGPRVLWPRGADRTPISVDSTQGETEPGGTAMDPTVLARAPAEQPFADDLVLARACLAGDEVALARLVRRLACIPRILDALRQEGYKFVTVSEMLSHLPKPVVVESNARPLPQGMAKR